MVIQGLSNAFVAYAAMKTSPAQREPFAFSSANIADTVSISAGAKAMLTRSQLSAQGHEIQSRLEAIKAKPAVERTAEDTQYVAKNDQRYAEIQDKIKANGPNGLDSLTADEVDYMQKATGFVNTMAELSPKEKALYDELVSKGNYEAAHALELVGMSRIGMGGQQVTLPNGRSFAPGNTEVTANNIRNLFRQMFVDPRGNIDRQFEALASYLDTRGTTGHMANNRVRPIDFEAQPNMPNQALIGNFGKQPLYAVRHYSALQHVSESPIDIGLGTLFAQRILAI